MVVIFAEFYHTNILKNKRQLNFNRFFAVFFQYMKPRSHHRPPPPHPYCHSLEAMEKYPIALSSHVEAHRATEAIAQLQSFFFHGTYPGSHTLGVSNIYDSPKPNTAHHKAPLITSLGTSITMLVFTAVRFLSTTEGRGTIAGISSPQRVPTGVPSPGVKWKE